MAESDLIAKPPNLTPGQIPATPSKFHSHFLYKVVMAIFFLVILPLVPSQAPEFINQTLLTRSWELLHLLFVGIAVSYGLFSRRNDEKEDEISVVSKFDNVQSYVSGLLHVSSVFDDEPETPSANNDESVSSSSDENKVQTWSNRYFRNESVVVAEERPVVNEQRVRTEKPLLLPVRSLKSSRVVVDQDESRTVSGSKLRASSRRLVSKSKRSSSGEFGGVSLEEIGDKLDENVALRSPVPWRSRSGRMEVQEEAENSPVYSPAAPVEESESNWIDSRSSSRPQTSRPSRASVAIAQKPSPSPSPSPRKPSPLPTVSPELQAKSAEDLVRKKSFYRSPPPPPPPPPPPSVRRVSSMKPSSWLNDNDAPPQKDLRRSFTSKPRSSIRDAGDDIDTMIGATANSSAEVLPRNYVDNQSMGKSVRTIRPGEVMNDQLKGKMDQNLHVQEFEENPIEFPDEEDKEELVEKLAMETDDDDMESEEEEEDDMVGQFIREDNGEPFNVNRRVADERSSSNEEEEASSSNMANDGGPDVDKKADEFIAKFREQIRLQRIESIKRSSGQIRRNTSRQT